MRKTAKRSLEVVSETVTKKALTESLPQISYFLVKSEPDVFSIDALASMPDSVGPWDGVRNAQARNIMKEMKVGDRAFFYHSNAKKETGIYGVVEIVRESYPDQTATTPTHKYFDPRLKGENKWVCVDVKLVDKWDSPLLLAALKEEVSQSSSLLKNMMLFKMSRLSVQRVTAEEWAHVHSLLK